MSQNKVGRREAILMFGAAGAALTLGCGGDSPTSPTTTGGSTTTGGTTNAACAVTPSETAGPFPSLTDLIRSDIREGKSGTTLTLTIAVVNSSNNCSPVENANVEIWQCDATGNYSQYGSQSAQTYLRGIQTTNSNGEVTFTTVYPGCTRGARRTFTRRSREAAPSSRRRRWRFRNRRMPRFIGPACMPRRARTRRRTRGTASLRTASIRRWQLSREIPRADTPRRSGLRCSWDRSLFSESVTGSTD